MSGGDGACRVSKHPLWTPSQLDLFLPLGFHPHMVSLDTSQHCPWLLMKMKMKYSNVEACPHWVHTVLQGIHDHVIKNLTSPTQSLALAIQVSQAFIACKLDSRLTGPPDIGVWGRA